MPTDHFQLSPASVEARFRLLRLLRRFNPDADDPLFRPVDADDFRIQRRERPRFQQSAAERPDSDHVRSRSPAKIRLIDPATNQPSNETEVDVWRMVPTVNDVKLTGDDGENPWPRGPEPDRWLPARRAVRTTCRSRRSRALEAHAQVQNLPPQRLLDDLASFQRVLFTNDRVRALSDAISDGTLSPAGSGSAPQRARDSRARPSSSAPAASATAVHASRPRPRYHSDRSLPRHPDAVSAARRSGSDGSVGLQAVSGTRWLGMSGRTRLRCLTPTPGPNGESARRPKFAGRAPIRVAPFTPVSSAARTAVR